MSVDNADSCSVHRNAAITQSSSEPHGGRNCAARLSGLYPDHGTTVSLLTEWLQYSAVWDLRARASRNRGLRPGKLLHRQVFLRRAIRRLRRLLGCRTGIAKRVRQDRGIYSPLVQRRTTAGNRMCLWLFPE